MRTIKLFLLISLVISFEVFTQSLSIGLGSGVNFIQGGNYYTDNLGRIGRYENLNGTNTSFTGLSLNTELQFQAGGKYSFENIPINLLADIQYYRMRGNEEVNIYDSFFEREFTYDATAKIDIWSLQLGSSYEFEFYSFKPFLTASAMFNYFGDVYYELAQDRYISEFPDYHNGMRYGYSFGVGISYNIISNIELEILSRYNDFNSFNGRDGEEKLKSTSVLFNIYYRIL
ncbi:MAG: hypothetical protein KJ799_16780 [Bacteroidetes bacterium]|nr:hypothetical protein [Bacteroidota bacterium]MBU1677938.1 hypothetical protein [Bacteroidota bacterium]MBU2508354.1 hypothetical protein [Bacteroidota bacterium]